MIATHMTTDTLIAIEATVAIRTIVFLFTAAAAVVVVPVVLRVVARLGRR